MSSRRALTVLALAAVAACLPDNPTDLTETGATSEVSTGPDPTGGEQAGLFGCSSPPCTVVLVSQSLDDRVDVYEVSAGASDLRGRILLDLKPDPSGQQIGDLLDEPYELALTATDLFVTVGHYPKTDRGSLLRFPLAGFNDLAPGGSFAVDRYFKAGAFTGGVTALEHGRQEGIFLLPHPSGRLLVGVFANDLKTTEWSTPSELLVLEPDLTAAPASFDLGALERPCVGGWRLAPLDLTASRIAVACDGSESVAVLTLPDDFATAPLPQAAAGITGCGLNLGGGDEWTTQFVAPDGVGGFLAVQSQLAESPKLWHVRADCSPAGAPSQDVPPALQQVRILRQPVLLRPGAEPMWLVAAGPPASGIAIVRGGASPSLCGQLAGLDALDSANAPWALALDATGTHLAIGAGPPSQPELAEGKGQVLWATLDTSKLDACEVTATDVLDLTAGRFQASAPETWVRAPNVIVVAELGGGGS